MFKKIVAVLLGMQFLTHVAAATTPYKICALPPAAPVGDNDHFELSRNCGGSYNATAANLAAYFLGKAPGSTGQIVFNSAGVFTAAPAGTVRGLLGLAPVASTGAYSSLTGTPPLATVATSGNYADLLNKPPLGSLAALNTINDSNWSGTAQSIPHGGTGATTQSGAQSALGLVPGTNVQAFSNELAGLAGLNQLGYVQRTGAGAYSASATIPLASIQGAGTAAAAATGTTGHALGYLDSNLAFSGTELFSGSNTHSGANSFTGTNLFSKNVSALPAAQSGAAVRVAGADTVVSRVQNDGFGAVSLFTAMRTDGTAASPAALGTGETIGSYNFGGYDGSVSAVPTASYRAVTSQAWTSTAHGTALEFGVTPNNTTAEIIAGHIENDGGIVWPTNVTGGSLGLGSANFTKLARNGAAVVSNGNTTVARSIQVANDNVGQTETPTNVVISVNDEISGYRELLISDATTARTLAPTDRGTTITFTNSSPITVTLPAAALSGFNVEIIQGGSGQVTFVPASGATLVNAHAFTKTFNSPGASVRLLVTGNAGGSAAAYNLAGDTGP